VINNWGMIKKLENAKEKNKDNNALSQNAANLAYIVCLLVSKKEYELSFQLLNETKLPIEN